MTEVKLAASEPENQQTLVHIARFPARWNDLDAFAHVNNGTYFNYFDEARVSWWQAMGVMAVQPKTGPIIASATCNFRKPILYPANLCIKVYVSPLRRSSFTVFYEVQLEQDPEAIYADGSTVVVWFDYHQQRSTPLTKELQQKLVQFY